jgi:hypothetical protein
MINRIQIANEKGWTIQEVYKARDAWRKLYARQPLSTITFDEYINMIQDAGLRPSMIGLRRGQYHLARFNDSGAYSPGNCRFIPQEQNQHERKEGYQRDPDFRKLMAEIALRRQRITCQHCNKEATPGMFARWHGDKCKHKETP